MTGIKVDLSLRDRKAARVILTKSRKIWQFESFVCFPVTE